MIKKVHNAIEIQETYIYLAPLEPDGNAVVYSTEPNILKKMWELYKKYPEDIKIKHDDKYGSEFLLPPNWIDIKPKKKTTIVQKNKPAKRITQNQKPTGRKKK